MDDEDFKELLTNPDPGSSPKRLRLPHTTNNLEVDILPTLHNENDAT